MNVKAILFTFAIEDLTAVIFQQINPLFVKIKSFVHFLSELNSSFRSSF